MNTFSLLAACVLSTAPQTPAPVNLGRVFVKGEKANYAVRSHLSLEARSGILDTWMPEDLDINYDFSYEVKGMKADGIAALHYLRPKMTIIEGETADAPPKATVQKVNFDLTMTVSPINEIIEFKENPKKTPVKSKAIGSFGPVAETQVGGLLGQFINELYRLALFSGSLDSSLDFSPKLKSPMVAVGDTWHKTVGYQPQKKSKSGKNVVQRLDYEYTYKGPVTINGKKFQRVEAKLDLKTDLTEFINDSFDVKSDETGIKKLPMTMKALIRFNLDPVSRHMVSAEAETEGGYQIFLTENEDRAVQEARMKGRTLVKLVSRTVPKR